MSNDTPDSVLTEPTESEVVNKTEPNTPEGTAPAGDVETKQDESVKSFKPIESQAELDALIQKRLLKEERKFTRKLEQQLQQREQQKVLQEPKREEFRDDDAYVQAQIDHLAEVKAAEKLAQREQAMKAEQRSESFFEKAEKASERYPDFQAVVGNPNLQINETMVEFIAESDLGADVAYHLGKNPLKAAQIAQLSPVLAARELFRLETEIANKPKPRPSNAPAPIAPISGASGGSKNPAEMTDAEYAKWRRTAKK